MKLATTSLIHKVIEPSVGKSNSNPTIILLHGRGADENDLLGLAPYLDPKFMFISVRAPYRYDFGGYTWYEILEMGSPEVGQFEESYNKLNQFLMDVQDQYPVDRKNIFLVGFSMGTVMAYALALTNPRTVKGVVAHSGYIPENTSLRFSWGEMKDVAFYIAHGTHDPVIPVAFGRRAHELLSNSGASVTYREYPIQHEISQESLHDFGSWLKSLLM